MSAAEREQKLLSLSRIVGAIAWRAKERMPRQAEYDDVRSAAWLAAIEAVDRFDPSRGVPLQLFAERLIKQRIVDWQRGQDPLTRPHRAAIKAGQFEEPMSFSIDQPVSYCEEFIPDTLSAPVSESQWIAAIDVQRLLEQTNLRPRHRAILVSYFFGARTMKEVGREFRIQESRVSQIMGIIYLTPVADSSHRVSSFVPASWPLSTSAWGGSSELRPLSDLVPLEFS